MKIANITRADGVKAKRVLDANGNVLWQKSNPWGRYIQDGLVFQLDCESGCTDESWLEIINGYLFTAKDIQIVDGVPTFNGTTSEYYSKGVPPYSHVTHTIEVVFKSVTAANNFIFYYGTPEGAIGCGLHSTFASSSSANVPWQRGQFDKNIANIVTALSFNRNVGFVHEGVILPYIGSDYPGSLMDDTTRIGRANTRWLRGNIYAIRIYNRHLTKEEIDANQAIDMERFGNR